MRNYQQYLKTVLCLAYNNIQYPILNLNILLRNNKTKSK